MTAYLTSELCACMWNERTECEQCALNVVCGCELNSLC